MNHQLFTLLIPFSFALSGLLVVFLIAKIRNNRLMRQFGLLAIQYGLTVQARKRFGFYCHPFIKGSYKFRDLHIGTYTEDFWKHAVHYTFVTVEVERAEGKTFDVYKESYFRKFENEVGGHDIKTGDAEFDERFLVSSNDEEFVKQVLDEKVRNKFFEDIMAKNFYGSVQLKDGKLMFTHAGFIKNDLVRELFECLVDLLYAVADRIDEVNKYAA